MQHQEKRILIPVIVQTRQVGWGAHMHMNITVEIGTSASGVVQHTHANKTQFNVHAQRLAGSACSLASASPPSPLAPASARFAPACTQAARARVVSMCPYQLTASFIQRMHCWASAISMQTRRQASSLDVICCSGVANRTHTSACAQRRL